VPDKDGNLTPDEIAAINRMQEDLKKELEEIKRAADEN
jgi:hypothetical protein